MEITNEIKELLQKQAYITTMEVSSFIADMCDKNRGNLSIGDMIRDFFKLNNKEIINENIKSTPTSSDPPKLKVIK